jgi:predicted ArsR family transcriptional regulator
MFDPVLQDLIKPGWRAVMAELKRSGGLPVAELARRLDASYMTVKQHCEDLAGLGYLERRRLPREQSGRPELLFRLTEKAESVFPHAGGDLALALLAWSRQIHGENTPERLLHAHFQEWAKDWARRIDPAASLAERVAALVRVRERDGCHWEAMKHGTSWWLLEHHNPMDRIYAQYPRVRTMETRAMASALGAQVRRVEAGPLLPGGHGRAAYEITEPEAGAEVAERK